MSRNKIYPIENLSEDSKHLFDTLNEGSELARVLIGTSFLDESLRSLLQIHFIKSNTVKNILSPNGFIGPFANKCDLAYCLDLINKKTYKDLKIIADIRNQFAHSHLNISFANQEIIDLTNKLTCCDIIISAGLGTEIKKPTEAQIRTNAMNRFKLTVVYLSQQLLIAGLSIKEEHV